MQRPKRFAAMLTLLTVLLSPLGGGLFSTGSSGLVQQGNTLLTLPVAQQLLSAEGLVGRAQAVTALLQQRGFPVQLEMIATPWNRITAENSDLLAVTADAYRTMAASGELYDLAADLQERPHLWAINTPIVWQSATLADAVYGIPLTRNYDELECAAHSGLYIRTDIFEELGLFLPETVDELISAAIMAKENGLAYEIAYENTAPPYALHRLYDAWPFFVDADSLLCYDGEGNVSVYPGSDAFYEDMQTLSAMKDREILRLYTATDPIYTALTRSWDVLAAFCPAPAPGEDLPYVVVQFEPQRANFNFNYAYGMLMAVSAYCTEPALALDVLACLYTDQEVFDAFVYGAEGDDYRIDGDGSITLQTDSTFYSVYSQAALARLSTQTPPRPASYYVEESTMVRTLPARLFMPENTQLRTRLMASMAYKGADGVLAARITGNWDAAVAAVSALENEGLHDYVQDCAGEYARYFD